MDNRTKKSKVFDPEPTKDATKEHAERLWSVGNGVQAAQPLVLLSVGDTEIGLNAGAATDFMGAFMHAFDSAFPVECRSLQRRTRRLMEMEDKDAPRSD